MCFCTRLYYITFFINFKRRVTTLRKLVKILSKCTPRKGSLAVFIQSNCSLCRRTLWLLLCTAGSEEKVGRGFRIFRNRWVIVEDAELTNAGFIKAGRLIGVCNDREIDEFVVSCYRDNRNISYERTTEGSGVGVVNVGRSIV